MLKKARIRPKKDPLILMPKLVRQCADCGIWEIYQRLELRWVIRYEATGGIFLSPGDHDPICVDDWACWRRRTMRMDWRPRAKREGLIKVVE